MNDPLRSKHVTQETLCTTLGDKKVHLLTVTEKGTPDEIKLRKGIVLTARIHPGESNTSFVMKGIINFLTDLECPEAILLRRNFVFKLIPMINPDGVALGNYRCSIIGRDLNRMWKNPDSTLFPEIAYIKKLVAEFHQQNPIVLYTDLHGHSRARRAFTYGNNYLHNPESTRVFPYILSKIAPDYFNYKKCKFKVEKSKQGTSRITLWRMIKTPAVYTLETSLCGGAIDGEMP